MSLVNKKDGIDSLIDSIIDKNNESNVKLMSEENNVIFNLNNDELSAKKKFGDYPEVDTNEQFPRIPVAWIRVREVNEYSMQKIDELTENIRQIGLISPIIVRPDLSIDDGKKYTISDGERRFTAWSRLYHEALELNDKALIEKYEYIQCKVLDSKGINNEVAIHHSANDQTRDMTVYERVARLHPVDIDELFGTDENPNLENRYEYIKIQYGEETLNKYINNTLDPVSKSKIKFNINSLCKFYIHKFREINTSVEISDTSLTRYIRSIIFSDKELITMTIRGDINTRLSMQLSSKTLDEQRAVLDQIKSGIETQNIFGDKENDIKTDDESNKQEEIVICSLEGIDMCSKNLKRTLDKYKDIINYKPKEKLTGNQKDYLKQLKKVLKSIEELQKMPQ